MARRQYHEEFRMGFAPVITDPAAPTVAQLETGGVHLTNALSPTGFQIPDEGQTVDFSDAGSRQNKTGRGRHGGGTIPIQGHRDSIVANDVVYQTLTNETDGYVYVRWFGGTDTPIVAGDKVTIAPVQVISRSVDAIGDGSQMVTVNCSIPDEIMYDVTVIA